MFKKEPEPSLCMVPAPQPVVLRFLTKAEVVERTKLSFPTIWKMMTSSAFRRRAVLKTVTLQNRFGLSTKSPRGLNNVQSKPTDRAARCADVLRGISANAGAHAARRLPAQVTDAVGLAQTKVA